MLSLRRREGQSIRLRNRQNGESLRIRVYCHSHRGGQLDFAFDDPANLFEVMRGEKVWDEPELST